MKSNLHTVIYPVLMAAALVGLAGCHNNDVTTNGSYTNGESNMDAGGTRNVETGNVENGNNPAGNTGIGTTNP